MADPAYWIGQDGNIYYGSGAQDAPVQNLGAATNGQFTAKSDGLYDNFTDSGVPALTFSATQIADPSAPPQQTSNLTTNNTASSPTKVFNQAGATNTQATIDQLPALLQAALEAEGTTYGNTVNGFNTAEAGQRKTYGDSTVTNQKNYDSNFMDSIRAGIHGLGGLMSLLRGTGAGGGTAEDLARDTVGGVTSNDIRGGADTQKENQGQLDSSLSTFLTDLQTKRKAAEDTRTNNERAIRRDSSTQLQDLFGKMAGFYGDVGNTAASNDWMNKAGALTPDIAANSKTQVSPYDTTPVIVHAPNLTAFAPPTQPSVTTAPNGQVGAGLFTMTNPKRRADTTAAPAPVGV